MSKATINEIFSWLRTKALQTKLKSSPTLNNLVSFQKSEKYYIKN